MSWPVGLPMGSVNFGKAAVMQSGENLPMRVSIEVVLASDAPSKVLVFRGTGQPLPGITTLFDSDEGTDTHTMPLPLCDTPNMGYGNGTTIVLDPTHEFTHVYRVTIDYLSPDRKSTYTALRTVKTFALTTAVPTGDIDDLVLIPAGSNRFGIPVSVPDVWSAQISAAEEAATDAAASAEAAAAAVEDSAAFVGDLIDPLAPAVAGGFVTRTPKIETIAGRGRVLAWDEGRHADNDTVLGRMEYGGLAHDSSQYRWLDGWIVKKVGTTQESMALWSWFKEEVDYEFPYAFTPGADGDGGLVIFGNGSTDSPNSGLSFRLRRVGTGLTTNNRIIIRRRNGNTNFDLFQLPVAVTNKALTSNVATLTAAGHGYAVGDVIRVAIGDTVFDSAARTVSAVTTDTFSFARTNANVASTPTTGTAERQCVLYSAGITDGETGILRAVGKKAVGETIRFYKNGVLVPQMTYVLTETDVSLMPGTDVGVTMDPDIDAGLHLGKGFRVIDPVMHRLRKAWVVNCAHRLGGTYPISTGEAENSLVALASLPWNVDTIETDFRVSLDGWNFAMHDPTFARTTNITLVFPSRVNDACETFTKAEIRQLQLLGGGGLVPGFDEIFAAAAVRPHIKNIVLDYCSGGYAALEAARAAAPDPSKVVLFFGSTAQVSSARAASPTGRIWLGSMTTANAASYQTAANTYAIEALLWSPNVFGTSAAALVPDILAATASAVPGGTRVGLSTEVSSRKFAQGVACGCTVNLSDFAPLLNV